jgi:NAD(P)-dependent dehydrogenase (short-subunit alcohol dehydrogenase family)
LGGLDVAFNNAGINGTLGPVTDLSLRDWRETLDTNLTSAFLGAKHQVPALVERGGGSILFTSSFVGHSVGFPGMAAYAASKAGIVGLMQVLAVELGESGVRVNAILPGGTDTPANAANVPGAPRRRGASSKGSMHEAHCFTRGDRPIGASPRIRCLELHHRHRPPRRRRSLGLADVETEKPRSRSEQSRREGSAGSRRLH